MKRIPKGLWRLFWGDNLAELSWNKHSKYISQVILKHGNTMAARWLIKVVGKKNLLNKLGNYKLDAKSKNFWKLVLS